MAPSQPTQKLGYLPNDVPPIGQTFCWDFNTL
jgi:hypothetical protein